MISARVFGAEAVAARLERAGREADAAEKATVVKGSILLRRMLVQHMTGRKGRDPFWGVTSPDGPYLGARTGQTRARLSPGGLAIKHGARWMASVGSPDEHVAMHEKGGTIHGRQFLRIPTAAAQTMGGQDRNAGRSIRGLVGVFLFRSAAGKLWAAMRGTGDSELTLLYLLVRSVTLRARAIFETVTNKLRPAVAAIGNAEIATVTRRANG